MARATGKNRCVICNKEKASLKCEGCSRTFCYNHLTDHRQELNKQFDEIETTRNLLRQAINEQTAKPQKHSLFQQIDEWEHDSIMKIRQTAEEARHILLRQTSRNVNRIETKLAKLTDQLRQNREENDFVETDLNNWKDELTLFTNVLDKPANVTIRQDTTALITKILVDVPTLSSIPSIGANAKWIRNGVIVAGSNSCGSGLSQLNAPYGIYVDDDQTLYVADYLNHRVMEWKSGAKQGQIVAGGNGSENKANQLNCPTAVIVDKETDSLIISDYGNRRVMRWPRRNGTNGEIIISDVASFGLTMDNYGDLYVCDYNKHEVKWWKMGDSNGTVVAGGNGRGNRLDQLNNPTHIFVDQDDSVYVSDSNNRVTKWMKGAEEGVVVAGGQGAGSDLTQLNRPRGIVVDRLGTIYVVDSGNHRVVSWLKGAPQGSIIVGGNGPGNQPNQFDSSRDLSFDQHGNLYISDGINDRVQKFKIGPHSN